MMNRKIAIFPLTLLSLGLFSSHLCAEEGTTVTGSGAIGAVSMDGQTYQQISLRPEFSLGELGVGLDLTLFIDENGDGRKEDWDEWDDLVDKIYYLRWAQKGDPFYLRGGALERTELGFGILVQRYSNTMEYPLYKRVGINFDVNLPDSLQVEGFIADIGELDNPGLYGVRLSYPIISRLRLGVGVVQDGNLYAGLHDDDGDGVPNPFDRYPDVDDAQQQTLWNNVRTNNPADVLLMKDYPGDAFLDQNLSSYSALKESVTAYSMDLSYELLSNLDLYIQGAKFIDYGAGFAPGIRYRPADWFSMRFEYRDYGSEFIGDFFSSTYDLERSVVVSDGSIRNKTAELAAAKATSGYYFDFHANILNLAYLEAAYSSMKPKDGGSLEDSNSLFAQAGINPDALPMISELSAYYTQTNVDKIFDLKTPSTVHGYRFGYAMSGGASLVFHWRTTYVDSNGDGKIEGKDETVKTFSMETAFTF